MADKWCWRASLKSGEEDNGSAWIEVTGSLRDTFIWSFIAFQYFKENVYFKLAICVCTDTGASKFCLLADGSSHND